MILIIGSNGQLGREMQRKLTKDGRGFSAIDYPDIDIASFESVKTVVEAAKPSAVVNCAAYTDVDQAEIDEYNAYRVNALGPKNLAQICNEKDIELLHISTDYVFSGVPIMENGLPRPYTEEDECCPNTAYGRTKLEGEKMIQTGCGRWYILRTAWLYGDGNNFVRTMLKLSENSDTVRVVNDQIGCPTSTAELANAVCALIGTGQFGFYHAVCGGQCSWYDFAKKIFELKGMDTRVIPVKSEEFPRPAKRPKWSVLENAHLKSAGKNVLRSWDIALKEYLEV